MYGIKPAVMRRNIIKQTRMNLRRNKIQKSCRLMHLPALTPFLLFGTAVSYIAMQDGVCLFSHFFQFDNVTEFHPNMLITAHVIQLCNGNGMKDSQRYGCGH